MEKERKADTHTHEDGHIHSHLNYGEHYHDHYHDGARLALINERRAQRGEGPIVSER